VTRASRQIVKSSGRASIEVADVLSNLLLAELLDPATDLFIVSAWISDIPIIDNSAGTFAWVEQEWETRWISFTEILVALMRRGVHVKIKTNTDRHNAAFVERLTARADGAGLRNQFETHSDADTHSKGIVGKTFALRGSMNLTYRGLREREETVELDVGTEAVSTFRLEFAAEWNTGTLSP
jgi:hypothetical protein